MADPKKKQMPKPDPKKMQAMMAQMMLAKRSRKGK